MVGLRGLEPPSSQQPQADQDLSSSNDLWRCPRCVVDQWWSLKDSPLQKSNFVLHRGPRSLHETTLSNSNPPRVSACSVPLRLAAKQISFSNFLPTVSGILLSHQPVPAVICRAQPHSFRHAPHRRLPIFNLHRARVRRNHGRLPSNGLIEHAQSSMLRLHPLAKTRARLSTNVIRPEQAVGTIELQFCTARVRA
jgi:hypothetical protein